MPSVLVVQRQLPAYRLPFFSLLRERLAALGIDLTLVVGPAENSRRDQGDLDWAVRSRNRVAAVKGREVVWQPVLRAAHAADLVIVEQANRLLANYVLLALGARVAFWGHGANLQARDRLSKEERLKRAVARRPHWWFAYTEGSRRRVEEAGFPGDRITVVQNAQDTEALAAAVSAQRRESDGPVGVFLSSLYPDKQLEFLLEAAAIVAERVPGFRLVLAGDGPDQELVVAAALEHRWVTYLGRIDGVDARARLLAGADLLLVPGLVGLVVLDAFAAGVPLVTTAYSYHSPEFEYLEHGVNGVVVDGGPEAYAAEIVSLLRDPARRARLRAGCSDASRRYTLGAMVDRFAGGVLGALS